MQHFSFSSVRMSTRVISRIIRRTFVDFRPAEDVPKKTSKPLRVLFCGSDEFSSASLRALHAEHKRNPDLVKSIDVMIRPGKSSGRSLKTVREVPIKAVAQELGLPIHERDTFTGWDLPRPQDDPINLIVAVSFGLFVPPRILKSAEYGGLNVHPSLLPDLRGPAPIHHTILENVPYTGVTLQTLDEKSFDHGLILAQTPPKSLPVPKYCTYKELHNILTPIASALLVRGLQDAVHVRPLRAINASVTRSSLTHAPKITSADREVTWNSRETIYQRHLALGRLWTDVYLDETTTKRVIFEEMELIEGNLISKPALSRISEIMEDTNETSGEEVVSDVPLPNNASRRGTDDPLELGPEKFLICAWRYPSGDICRSPVYYREDNDTILFASRKALLKVTKITIAGQSTKTAAAAVRLLQKETAGRWKLREDTHWNTESETPRYNVEAFVPRTKEKKKGSVKQPDH